MCLHDQFVSFTCFVVKVVKLTLRTQCTHYKSPVVTPLLKHPTDTVPGLRSVRADKWGLIVPLPPSPWLMARYQAPLPDRSWTCGSWVRTGEITTCWSSTEPPRLSHALHGVGVARRACWRACESSGNSVKVAFVSSSGKLAEQMFRFSAMTSNWFQTTGGTKAALRRDMSWTKLWYKSQQALYPAVDNHEEANSTEQQPLLRQVCRVISIHCVIQGLIFSCCFFFFLQKPAGCFL